MPPRLLLRGVVLVFLAVAAFACDWNREPEPCECPHLEKAVDQINWAPGLVLSLEESANVEGMLSVQRAWKGSEKEVIGNLERLEDTLVQTGYEVDRSEPQRVMGTLDNLTIRAGANEAVGELDTEFFVTVNQPEPDSADKGPLLDPLEQALGGWCLSRA